MRDAVGLVLQEWPRACLFGFYERFSVLWRKIRGSATAPARHCCRRLALAMLLVALVVVHSRFTYDTQGLLLKRCL
jgi:hypothetical protein